MGEMGRRTAAVCAGRGLWSGMSKMGVTGSNRRNSPIPRKSRHAAASPASSASSNKMEFTIASDFSEGRTVQKQILDQVQQCGFDGDAVFAIKLALEEALINAIKHGNKLDPKKKVKIEALVSPVCAEIVIEDQGPGFNRSAVPDPTAEENLTKCSGRGLLLMETYMSKVNYSKKGRRVHMVKQNETK